MTKKITATFTGQDGLLGYETNKEYTLMIGVSNNKLIIERMNDEKRTFEGFCEYGSVLSFLANWDNIKRVPENKMPDLYEIKISDTDSSVSTYHQNGFSISVANIDMIGPDKWWISRVNVKENDRGKGIGSAILKKAIEVVLSKGCAEIIVCPGGYNSDYKKQVGFYKKNGFTGPNENGEMIYALESKI